jgi:transcriptional regulator with XRE-family HTH domain
MSAIEERLGEKIAGLRRAAGYTQAQLAERAGVQTAHISRIETGKRGVSIEVISTIAQALDVELHELFRLQERDDLKASALDRFMYFGSRLSTVEVDLVMTVGSAVLQHVRLARQG